MTRTTLVAALFAAAIVLPGSALAQTDAPPPSVERAHQLFTDGRPGDALAMLHRLPPSVDGARLRIDIALAGKDFPQAVDAYEQLAGPLKSPSHDALAAIARGRALALRADPDPQVRVAACESLMIAAAAADCAAALESTANDATESVENRVRAARVLVDHKVPGAAALLDLVIGQGIQNSPSATAEALGRIPAQVSNEPLTRLLGSSNADAQYLAARALAPRRVKDAMPALRAVATDPEAGAARLMAYIGLAALGEADGVKVLRETLPLMKGRERLEAARALTILKDPAGMPMLESLLTAEQELTRIETAELLYRERSARATSIITAGTESANPWVRASALDASARLGMPVTRAVRRAIADTNPQAAAAAARAVLIDLRARR